MTEAQQATAIRLLREQEIVRTNRNNLIRDSFKERITIAMRQECDQRDREIEALNLTIAMVEAAEVTSA